jgi:hypothetical protein
MCRLHQTLDIESIRGARAADAGLHDAMAVRERPE